MISNPPPDHRAVRNEWMRRVLTAPLIAAVVFSVIELTVPPLARIAGGCAVATIVLTPLIRLVWLINRWIRRGDLKFAAAGISLLGVIAIGTIIAMI